MPYDLSQSLDSNGDGLFSESAAWVLGLVRFRVAGTFSRATMSSRTLDGSDVVAERPRMAIVSDCSSLAVRGGKESHVKNLVATLRGERDYLAEVLPDDWVFAWFVRSEDAALDLAHRFEAGESCNEFSSGLKFIGRVYSVRRRLSASPDGVRSIHYMLQGNGFAELNSKIYWDPYLSMSAPTIDTWLGRLGVAVSKFFADDGIDMNKAIPTLIEIIFGSGINQRTANPAGEDALRIVTGSTEGSGEAPYAYCVPASVGSVLSTTSRSKGTGVFAYADVLVPLFGRQIYEGNPNGPGPWADFLPTDLKPMMGRFLPDPPDLSGRSAWSVLADYLNPAVNEMFTCLRTDYTGRIQPTLVVRQLPFSTSLLDLPEKTEFLSLPRWKLPASMVSDADVGRTGAMRFNFEQLTGAAIAQAQPDVVTYARVNSPAIRDDQDSRRNGLCPDMQTVNVGIYEQQLGPEKWQRLRADMLFGAHMHLNGTVTCLGIIEPIAEGDNLEFDGVVYHLEEVSHVATRDESGRGTWRTNLVLSHGVRADQSTSTLADPDDKIWAATAADEMTDGVPGLTYDAHDDAEGPSQGDFGGGASGAT
jgi:hypothetical protein